MSYSRWHFCWGRPRGWLVTGETRGIHTVATFSGCLCLLTQPATQLVGFLLPCSDQLLERRCLRSSGSIRFASRRLRGRDITLWQTQITPEAVRTCRLTETIVAALTVCGGVIVLLWVVSLLVQTLLCSCVGCLGFGKTASAWQVLKHTWICPNLTILVSQLQETPKKIDYLKNTINQ